MWANIYTQKTAAEKPPKQEGGFWDGWEGWYELDPTPPVPPEGYEILSTSYVKSPTEDKAIIQAVFGNIAERQAAKPAALKSLENLYVAFLANEWTPVLRTKGLIAPEASVTVSNTSEEQNITYLLTIKGLGDIPTYSYYSNEFTKYKFMITGAGGTMADVAYHADV